MKKAAARQLRLTTVKKSEDWVALLRPLKGGGGYAIKPPQLNGIARGELSL